MTKYAAYKIAEKYIVPLNEST